MRRTVCVILAMWATSLAYTFDDAPASAQQSFLTIEGDQFAYEGTIVKLKGTNYYPQCCMWAAMWTNWNWPAMQGDADAIRGLGMNCVRILVPYSHGGWGGASPPPERLRQLEDLVNLMGSRGIRSCVTLFDWETSFPAQGTSTEADHLSHLSAIVSRLKDNKNVFLWDVKNEPDHPANIGGYDNWDSNPIARDRIVSWLERMCLAVRAIDPNHPVSAGIRWWENVEDCLSFVDVAIFHSYWPNIGTQEIPDVKRYMGAEPKPILVEEFGWPSNPDPCYRDGQWIDIYDEAEQLNVYANHLAAIRQHDTAGCIQWMTHDARSYTTDPRQSFENYFGLWRFDLSLKPAGEYYRDQFTVCQFFGPLDATPPAPVTQFVAVADARQIRLSWQNPTDADFVATMVRMSTTAYPSAPSSGTAAGLRYAPAGSGDGLALDPLVAGTTYYFSAFARDYSGNWSPAARVAATPMPDTTPPSPVTAFTATATGTSVRLSWRNPDDADFRGTMIRYGTNAAPAGPTDGLLLADRVKPPGTTDAITHADIVPGMLYYYAAFAYDNCNPANYAAPAVDVSGASGPTDFDGDGDVDLTDFGYFQMCFNGPNRVGLLADYCESADVDRDGDVDLSDFGRFQTCFNGPNRPMPTACVGG